MILVMILLGAGLCVLAVNLMLAVRYPQINSQLRFFGWILDKFCNYQTAAELRSFAKKQTGILQQLPSDKEIEVHEVIIKNRDGNPLSVIVYRAKQYKQNAVGLLWTHGGGYAMNSARGELSVLKGLLLATNTVAFAPEYRRSIEAEYPAALYDSYDTLLWLKEHAEEFGVNTDQLFVGGCSAGGGLAAAVSLYARDDRRVNVAFQMPIYPMLDDRLNTSSMIGNQSFVWDEAKSKAGWQLYLGDLYGTGKTPKYAAAARETDYRGLPPAYSFVGDLDPFLEETKQYIQNLREAGVEAVCDVYKGAFHGFDIIPSRISKKARKICVRAYRYAAEHYFAPQNDYV